MRSLATLLTALVLVGSCSRPEPGFQPEGEDALARSRHAIIGGAFDPGDPAVVAFGARSITYADAGAYLLHCTGTLIAPRTVLTAGHCAHADAPADGGPDPYLYVVLFTDHATGNSLHLADGGAISQFYADCPPGECEVADVVSQNVHPNFTNTPTDIHADFTVLQLAQPVTDVGWISIYTDALDQSFVGRNVRHVGFGQTVGGDEGIPTFGFKRQATYPLRAVQPDKIESVGNGHETCQGDSGGPTLLVGGSSRAERVAGVVSYGDSNCLLYGFDGRVDAFQSFITSTMAGWESAPSCALDGYCVPGCGDPDCRAFEGSCSADALCESQHCWTDPQHPSAYCTRSCSGSAPCPVGMVCPTSGFCEYPQRHAVQSGGACTPADYCAGSGVCEGLSGAPPTCEQPCDPEVDGGVTCPYATQTCTLGENGSRFCKNLPKIEVASTTLELGHEPGCSATDGLAWAIALLTAAWVLSGGRRIRRPRP